MLPLCGPRGGRSGRSRPERSLTAKRVDRASLLNRSSACRRALIDSDVTCRLLMIFKYVKVGVGAACGAATGSFYVDRHRHSRLFLFLLDLTELAFFRHFLS